MALTAVQEMSAVLAQIVKFIGITGSKVSVSEIVEVDKRVRDKKVPSILCYGRRVGVIS